MRKLKRFTAWAALLTAVWFMVADGLLIHKQQELFACTNRFITNASNFGVSELGLSGRQLGASVASAQFHFIEPCMREVGLQDFDSPSAKWLIALTMPRHLWDSLIRQVRAAPA